MGATTVTNSLRLTKATCWLYVRNTTIARRVGGLIVSRWGYPLTQNSVVRIRDGY